MLSSENCRVRWFLVPLLHIIQFRVIFRSVTERGPSVASKRLGPRREDLEDLTFGSNTFFSWTRCPQFHFSVIMMWSWIDFSPDLVGIFNVQSLFGLLEQHGSRFPPLPPPVFLLNRFNLRTRLPQRICSSFHPPVILLTPPLSYRCNHNPHRVLSPHSLPKSCQLPCVRSEHVWFQESQYSATHSRFPPSLSG